jgi:hypothetical protein
MYKALTQTIALSLFKNVDPDKGKAVLNDLLGDAAHFDFADCIAASVEICESLEVKDPLAAVVHIEIDDDLMRQLIHKGHMKRGGKDQFGKETWQVDAAAAATINRVASSTVSFHQLGLVIRNERPAPDRVH